MQNINKFCARSKKNNIVFYKTRHRLLSALKRYRQEKREQKVLLHLHKYFTIGSWCITIYITTFVCSHLLFTNFKSYRMCYFFCTLIAYMFINIIIITNLIN